MNDKINNKKTAQTGFGDGARLFAEMISKRYLPARSTSLKQPAKQVTGFLDKEKERYSSIGPTSSRQQEIGIFDTFKNMVSWLGSSSDLDKPNMKSSETDIEEGKNGKGKE